MSRCGRGPALVFWLLAMSVAIASERMLRVHAEGRSRNGVGLGLGGAADHWRDWLLEEDARPAASDAEAGPLVRRITPKSVFVAPSLSGCSDGYRQDGMGRCVKPVKVNQAAQLDFILQKLNAKFAPTSSKKQTDKDESGPFHVSIPLSYANKNPVQKNDSVASSIQHSQGTSRPTETTTATRPTESDTITTRTDMPLLFAGETDHRPQLENTVKRQPETNSRPFVIVVANRTNQHSPFVDVLYDTEKTTTATETPIDDYMEGSTVDSGTAPTTEFTVPDAITTTEAVSLLDETVDADRTSTLAATTTDVYDGDESTPASFVASTTDVDRPPTFMNVNLEDSTISSVTLEPATVFSAIESQTPSVSYSSEELLKLKDTQEGVQGKKEKESVGKGHYVGLSLMETETETGRPYEDESEKETLITDDVYDPSASYNYATTSDCESLLPSQESKIVYGRRSPGGGCRTEQVTTIRYPVRTISPYRIRFPTDDLGPEQSLSYQSASLPASYTNDGFVRFPERPAITPPHRPPPFGTKIRDGTFSSSTSSASWYPSPPSWFQFFQAPKNRPHYENNADGYVPLSTVFRKHDFRPFGHASPHGVRPPPVWIDKRIAWPPQTSH